MMMARAGVGLIPEEVNVVMMCNCCISAERRALHWPMNVALDGTYV